MTDMGRIADVSLKATLAAAQSEVAYLKERYADALERERLLLEQLSALQWQPITPENLPKVGDEVLRHTKIHSYVESIGDPSCNEWPHSVWKHVATHYRPVNAPQDVEKKRSIGFPRDKTDEWEARQDVEKS